MPSGKKSKQRRRIVATAATAPRRKAGARRQASPRVLALAGGVIAAVAVAVVLAIVLSGGKNNSVGTLPTRGSTANGLPSAAAVEALLKGIPQHGLTLGSRTAPALMIEYVDLQCPYCQQLETQVMPDIVRRYVRTGKLRIDVRVLAFIGPDSGRGRNAMVAAGLQGKAFNFAQLLYDNQGTENTSWLSDDMVARAAGSIPGLDPRQLFAVRDSDPVKKEAATFDERATGQHVTSTPTIFIGTSAANAAKVSLNSPTDEGSLVSAIRAALTS